MARLLYPPEGLHPIGLEILSGPRTIGAARTETIGGRLQTVASAFGAWRFRYSFPPLRGQLARRYRGWIAGLHAGANATRWNFCDWDGLSFADAGSLATQAQLRDGLPWSNGMPWSNGKNWRTSRPIVGVSGTVAAGATEITLSNQFWGHSLGVGDIIGFFPYHLALYEVTQRISAGNYRIWPPLRKGISSANKATLNPTMALRLEAEEAAPYARGATSTENLSITFVEVFDLDVRQYFKDT